MTDNHFAKNQNQALTSLTILQNSTAILVEIRNIYLMSQVTLGETLCISDVTAHTCIDTIYSLKFPCC